MWYVDIHSFCIQNVCAMPKSIYNMCNFTCDNALFQLCYLQLYVWYYIYWAPPHLLILILHLTCAMCSILYATGLDQCMLYPYTCSYAACLTPCMMCLKNHVAYLNSFITWAETALSESLFSWLCDIGKFICCMLRFLCGMGRFIFWSFGDCSYCVIVTHDFRLWSNLHNIVPHLK